MNINQSRKVAAYTLGCKVNMYDTEAMLELFRKKNYNIVNFDEYADIYIINTCTVTNIGSKKSRQIIKKAKKANINSIIVVTGCYAQVSPEEIKKIDGVNLVLGTTDRNKIVELVERKISEKGFFHNISDIMKETKFEELSVKSYYDRCRAYVKIEEGCDRYCSYCIIPYTRGIVKSREVNKILEEVEILANNGYKEVVLAGIHVASYGKDLININLLDVIEQIHKIDGIERIRMSSIEPNFINNDFINKIKKLPKVCDHFHLSLQSGCNKTLSKMNRKYTKEQFRDSVNKLRNSYPDVALTTDIIVGFPGETEEDFEESYNFVKEVQFTKIHVFPYSPKAKTPAAKFDNQISKEIKNKRSEQMLQLSKNLNNDFLYKFLKKSKSVLFESMNNDNFYEGHTTNYIPVKIKHNSDLINKICNITINDIKDGYVYGKLLQ